MLCASGAFGQAGGEPAAPPEPVEAQSPWSFEATVNLPTAYFDRGYLLSNGGYVVQSEAYLYWNAIRRDDFTLSPYIGVWTSFLEEKGPQNPKHFDEVDLIAGVLAKAGNWEIDVYWNLQSFPAGTFDQIQELTLSVAYTFEFKDSPFTLTPKASIYQEFQNLGDDENLYFELELTPAWEKEDCRWSFELPIIVGLSGDGWYANDDGHNATFGYVSAELIARYALSENWSILGGVRYYYLSADTLADYNNGSRHAVVGRVAMEFAM